MAVKSIVEKALNAGEFVIIVSLDIRTAFDAAWWPNIIKSLQDCRCPKNLYYLIKSYLTKDVLYCQPTASKWKEA